MRVDELQRRMGDAIEVQWKSFLLRTEPKHTTVEKFTKYTKSWQTPAEMEPAASFTTPWGSGANPPTSSLPAQIAWKATASFGPQAQQRFHHALLDAYFVQNRDISDRGELADIAAACDIDRAEFDQILSEQGGDLSKLVIDEHNDAIGRGITAVPTVVLGEAFPIPGAQDVETYERLVERMIARQSK